MGADQKSCRREAVDGEECPGGHTGRPRLLEEARANHADHRSVAALRSGLREDLAALPSAPRAACRCLRARVVQAHAPRYGPDRPLSWAARAEGDVDLAGPDSAR